MQQPFSLRKVMIVQYGKPNHNIVCKKIYKKSETTVCRKSYTIHVKREKNHKSHIKTKKVLIVNKKGHNKSYLSMQKKALKKSRNSLFRKVMNTSQQFFVEKSQKEIQKKNLFTSLRKEKLINSSNKLNNGSGYQQHGLSRGDHHI